MSSPFIRKIDNYVVNKVGSRGRSFLLLGSSAAGILIVFDYKFAEIVNSSGNVAGLQKLHHLWWLRLTFGRSRSRLWGYFMNKKAPLGLRMLMIKSFSYFYDCNLEELRYPLESYRCLGHFFARTLIDGARPLEDLAQTSMLSPCDGEITAIGDVISNQVAQIKGSYYNLSEFLGISPREVEQKKLKFCVVYLAPGDYHHFHAPCQFKLNVRRSFSGELFPVNKSFLKLMNNVFSINERVVMSGKWEYGNFHFAAIGAYNVGNIRLASDPKFRTNELRTQLWYLGGDINAKTYNDSNTRPIQRGEHIGEFRMGSTVVMVFEAPTNFEWTSKVGDKVKVGQRIGGTDEPANSPNETSAFYFIDPLES